MKASDPGYAKAVARYCDMRAQGKGVKECLKATGLSHVQADYAWLVDPRNKNHVVVDESFATLPSDEAKGLRLAEWRLQGESIGRMTARAGLGQREGETARLFFAATGLSLQGTRVGKGGRFLEVDGKPEKRFYVGAHKAHGVEAPKPKELDPERVAAGADTYRTKLPAAVKKAAAKAGRKVKEEAEQS